MQLDLPARKRPTLAQSEAGSDPRTSQHRIAPGPMRPAGKPGGTQACMAGQEGSQGPKDPKAEAGVEALVLLEEDAVGWDAADLHSVKQKANGVPGMHLPLTLVTLDNHR